MRIRRLWFFASLLVTSPALAADFGPFTEPPEVTRLPNGLSLVTIPWHSPGIVAYYSLVRVGARDEVEPGHSGFAHLFEHMMFRGTERLSESQYEERLQAFGADNNAYTTQDFTLYTITAPSSALAEIVENGTDRGAIADLADPLLGVPSELKVLSAHRTPERVNAYVSAAPGRGVEVFIACAGNEKLCVITSVPFMVTVNDFCWKPMYWHSTL